jgi:hypothetical protein
VIRALAKKTQKQIKKDPKYNRVSKDMRMIMYRELAEEMLL